LRDAIELMVVSASGDAARAAELEKRSKTPRTSEQEARASRRRALQGHELPPEERAAVSEARIRQEAFCPYEKESVPRDLPRAGNDEMALDVLLAFAPRALAKMRLCEVLLPESRGMLERAWSASALSRLAIPRLREAVEPVRAWMTAGPGPPAPGSKLDNDLKDSRRRRQQEAICAALSADLQRIEAALPPSFLQKFVR
jgi:hypothetical protein